MDSSHEATLCQMLAVQEVPAVVRDAYMRWKLMIDRTGGAPVNAVDLACMVLASGYVPKEVKKAA